MTMKKFGEIIKKNSLFFIISIIIIFTTVNILSKKNPVSSSEDCYNKNFKVYKNRGKSDAEASSRAKNMCK